MIHKVQQKMEELVIVNEELLLMVQNRAEKLIENYINLLGEAVGMTY